MEKKPELKKPNYYHIPKIVAENVKPHESFVFSVIYWFEKMKDGKCIAGNDRIAEALPYKSSNLSVANALNTLEKKGLIKRIFADKNKRTRKEIVSLVDYKVSSTDDTGIIHRLYEVSSTDEQNSKRLIVKDNISNIYGEFKNVQLSDEEIEKLKQKIPNYLELIESLSTYMAQSTKNTKKYTSHYATILSWSRKNGKELQKSFKSFGLITPKS